MTTRMIVLAAALLLLIAVAAPAQAQQKMTYEEYQAELAQWQEREQQANAALEDCESQKSQLRAEIEGLDSEISTVWNEVFDELGATDTDVDAFAQRFGDFERSVNRFGRLSPEQMYEQQDELAMLEKELKGLSKEPQALLTQFKQRIDRAGADLDSYRKRMAGPRSVKYTVMRGDHLWGIAKMPDHYGDGAKWMRIYSVNREKIDDPDLIYPEQAFSVPLDIDKNSQYLVKRGDFLAKIAEEVYGDPYNWRDLYEANRELMPDENMLYENTILTVPGRGGSKMMER